MKRITLAIATAALAVITGCSTMQRLGISDDIVADGVQAALVREGLTGTVTDAQVREVIAIIKAEGRLQEIGEEIGQQQAVQDRINALVEKYLKK